MKRQYYCIAIAIITYSLTCCMEEPERVSSITREEQEEQQEPSISAEPQEQKEGPVTTSPSTAETGHDGEKSPETQEKVAPRLNGKAADREIEIEGEGGTKYKVEQVSFSLTEVANEIPDLRDRSLVDQPLDKLRQLADSLGALLQRIRLNMGMLPQASLIELTGVSRSLRDLVLQAIHLKEFLGNIILSLGIVGSETDTIAQIRKKVQEEEQATRAEPLTEEALKEKSAAFRAAYAVLGRIEEESLRINEDMIGQQAKLDNIIKFWKTQREAEKEGYSSFVGGS